MSGEELNDVSPGRILATARDAIGVTQREVADALNLPIHIVAALEGDDLDKLPSPVFARGYMRAYAKLLEIDPEPLLAELKLGTGSETQLIPPADPTRTRPGISPRTLTMGAAALVVVLFLVLVVSVFDGEPEEQSGADGEEIADQTETGEPPPTPAASNEPGFTEPAAMPQDVVESEAEPDPLPQTTEESAAAPAGGAEVAAAPSSDLPGLRRLTPQGDERLSLEFTEECWVEIKDPRGRVLYGNLGKPGQTLDFVGEGPFHVLLGYAPGVSLRFNFENVALGPHTRQDVANLVLGQ